MLLLETVAIVMPLLLLYKQSFSGFQFKWQVKTGTVHSITLDHAQFISLVGVSSNNVPYFV